MGFIPKHIEFTPELTYTKPYSKQNIQKNRRLALRARP
jgi:hypothetical protein